MKNRWGKKWLRRAKSVLLLLLLATVLIGPAKSDAARPLVTDDADTAGKGMVQAEFGMEWSSWKDREDGVTMKETRTEASAVLTYGISDRIDLVAGIPYAWGRIKEDGTTVFNKNGISDVSFETKWRFLENGGLGLALKPGITLPTGDHRKGFGTGRVTYGLNLVATKVLEPFTFSFNGGYSRNENKVGDRKDLWSASLAASYEAMKGLNIVGDIGLARNVDPTAQTAPAFALVGLNYAFNAHIILDAGFKFGLNKQEADHSIIAGVTLSF
jgi:hypothetical protein